MTSKTVATSLVEEWILRFGAPDTLHTDQGTNFNSEVMKDLCQVFIDLYYPKPPGDPRLELGEMGTELNEKLYEVHSHAQMTMGKEQRRQKEYYQRKIHGGPFNPGDLLWLLEPHRAKSRKFHLPWRGPYEVLKRTSEVNYHICKQGFPDKWQNVHFNRLKPYLGESPSKHSERLASKPTPNFEERAEESDPSGTETEEQAFHVYRPTSAETQADQN